MAQTQGIRTRHSRTCASATGARCNCSPTYEAWVYSKRDERKIRKSFPTLAAAKGWRTDALKAVKDKKLRAPTSRTLREEVDEWLAGARDGTIRNKRKAVYKPAVVRNYELALRLRVLPVLGDRKLADITHADLMELQEELTGEAHSDSTVRNTFVPLQAIYRRAWKLQRVPMNPAIDLELPTAGQRERAATPTQAAEFIAVLGDLGALWATAFYSGLRRGEIEALRNRDVDLDAGTIRVDGGWDAVAGRIPPKSAASYRTVFVLEALRPYLEPLRDRWDDPDALFLGETASSPMGDRRKIDRQAQRALKAENDKRIEKAAGTDTKPELVEWWGFHEARHSFSTWLDATVISETRSDRYMGHAAPGVAGRYRHLLPGQISDDARIVDAYLSGHAAGKVVELKRPAVG